MRPIVKQRKKMWEEDPHCRKCGIKTILPEDLPFTIENGLKKIKKLPDNMATIQHIFSRLNPLRKDYGGVIRTHVLWCKKCNEEESIEEQSKLSIEELRARSQGHKK